MAADVAERDLQLRVRRTTDPILHEVVDVPEFCAPRLRYRPFGHNAWIGRA